MTDALAPFTIKIKRPNLNRYAASFYNYDVECACCGRPLKNRAAGFVAVHRGQNAEGEDVFLPVPEHELPNDPVEWGSFIGPHCQRLLPKTHKVSYKKLLKNHSDTWA